MTSADAATGTEPPLFRHAGVHVLGVRHHGPGSARSVLRALTELEPDAVVIEGAPELDALVPHAADAGLVPPVAGLVYVADEPRRASFYPLAEFSPEWVALRWAAERGVPVRFADLPAAHAFALASAAAAQPDEPDTEEEGPDTGEQPPRASRLDPLATLARAAGYEDAERWWEDAVEHRRGGQDSVLPAFVAVSQAMAEVRAIEESREGFTDVENDRREASMRRVLRAVAAEHEVVAVVCGAYHAPRLEESAWPPKSHDTRTLTKLPKVKVTATWAPWSAGRLATESGYGAGVTSPGWYQHLFAAWRDGTDVVSGWLARVARELRTEGIDAPPASVVETVRAAEALAALRDRPSVGLSELTDATTAVLCGGSELPMRLIHDRLVVGSALGSVPEHLPRTPLAQDLAKQQRSCRLKVTPEPQTVSLDLRRDAGRARSLLLHRLRLLGVGWGTELPGWGAGTFREEWELAWEPELEVAVVEAGLHGTTVLDAASGKVAEEARRAGDLATLGGLVEQCLLAELPDAVGPVVDALAERTAQHADALALLRAVEPLARTRRYGDVRGSDTHRVAEVLRTIALRGSVGLRPACVTLDDDAAEAMRAAVDAAHRGLALLERDPLAGDLGPAWTQALGAVAGDDRVHGSVAGRACRLLLDGGHLDADEAAARMGRRLSRGADAAAGAAWLDGFLDGDALLLLHDATLLGLVDQWVAGVPEETFEDLLPLLRRTFSRYTPPERAQIGTRLRRGPKPAPSSSEERLDLAVGMPAALTVAEMLGLPLRAPTPADVADDREVSA
ncbi:DUF5682 family protein [Nocardioides bruguierae]|uniref:DUF5682 family protein n=1 Tax=Nocardioides bruguierae TaxID=2945102 RepID=UPI002022130E|nr:DUF5682 family protein [Nocardioides bruguierae]MCL8026120.1 DUF5682 family protein [Nocardioides bruguierae]